MAKMQSNGGTPNPSANRSAEENDRIRRAKKARQRSAGGRSPVMEGFLEGYLADQRVKRDAARARAQTRRDANEARAQRQADLGYQAAMACDHPEVIALIADSPAARLVVAALAVYPTVECRGLSRTEAAIAAATASLSDEDKRRRGGLYMGAGVVRRALRWAWHEQRTPATAAV